LPQGQEIALLYIQFGR